MRNANFGVFLKKNNKLFSAKKIKLFAPLSNCKALSPFFSSEKLCNVQHFYEEKNFHFKT